VHACRGKRETVECAMLAEAGQERWKRCARSCLQPHCLCCRVLPPGTARLRSTWNNEQQGIACVCACRNGAWSTEVAHRSLFHPGPQLLLCCAVLDAITAVPGPGALRSPIAPCFTRGPNSCCAVLCSMPCCSLLQYRGLEH